MAFLAAARYGKDKVRVLRVLRGEHGVHDVVEYSVCVLLEGDIAAAWTDSDNSNIVATDSIKNTIYLLAKSSVHVATPELYGLELAAHFLATYPHIHTVHVDVVKLKWSRIPVAGAPHKHSFVRNGDEKRFTRIVMHNKQRALSTTISSGLRDLLVLKTTESSFEGFLRDEYTTLPEVDDRIFSTSIDYTYQLVLPLPSDLTAITAADLVQLAATTDLNGIHESTVTITSETFATHNSASVQATLYLMATTILATHPAVSNVEYTLPNKHYFAVDMSYKGVANTAPRDAEVFLPVDAPAGLIVATVARQ